MQWRPPQAQETVHATLSISVTLYGTSPHILHTGSSRHRGHMEHVAARTRMNAGLNELLSMYPSFHTGCLSSRTIIAEPVQTEFAVYPLSRTSVTFCVQVSHAPYAPPPPPHHAPVRRHLPLGPPVDCSSSCRWDVV